MSEESISTPQKIAAEVEIDDVGVNTSPGQLQDVTMDHTYAICAPCVSIQHAGSTSPGQGRSIREFEEQMASLRKENFNLKLRIYFLEEKLPGRSSSNADGHENLMKKNIDLQVDIEVLRKELHEKQSLLCEAAKAMELMEEQQKASEEKNKEIFEELNQKINFLEIENKQLERSTNQSQINQIMGRSDVNGDIDTIQKIRELEGCVKQYNESTEELNIKINEMEDMITQKDIKIKEFEQKIKALMFQNAELQEQLDIKDKEISNAERKYQEFNKIVEQDKEEKASEFSSENKALKSTIQKLKTELENEQIHGCDRQKMLKHQKELIDQMQLTIASKEKTSAKLSKTLEQYERKVSELNAEKKNLQNQIHQLQILVKKLEISQVSKSDPMSKRGEIFLGTRSRAGAETTQLNPKDLGGCHNYSHPNENRANPLFFGEPVQEFKESLGNKEGPNEYKLKEKLNASPSTRSNNTRNIYPHPSFYINETKSYHNSSSSYLRQRYEHDERKCKEHFGDAALPLDFTCDLQSCNCNFIKHCTRNNCQTKLTSNAGPKVKLSCSDSSIISSSSMMNIRREEIKNFEASIHQLSVNEMGHPEKLFKYSRLREEVYDYKVQLADKACILEEIESKLKEKTAAYENACKVIKNFTLHSQDLQQQIDNLKKENSLGNSMQIKEDTYGNHSTALCKSFTDSLEIGGAIKDELEEIIEEKNYEVNQLNMEIKENRSNLQNLINKEIRQKLCQIENLSKLLSLLTSSVSSAPTSPMRTVDELQQCFTEFDLNVAIDRNMFLQKKINDQTQQLFSELELKKSNELTADQLNTKINEAEMSHRWSREACVILTARLEELAGFLDSLLKHKDVLGALGADRSREMRKAIDKSLDFSRSLNNMSLNMTGVSMTEQSLAQLTNITGLFDMTVDKENLSFTENKVTEQIQLIENLQTEIKTLKKELSHRKVSGESLKKERRSLPPFFENQSESETWSEPDRSVSLARMGLEKSPGFNRTKGSEVEQLSTSTGSDTDRKGKSKSREKISKLEKIIADKDDRLLEIQCQLVEADNRLKQEGLRVRDAIEELEEYKKMNDILEAELNDYRSKAHHFGGNLEIENESLKRAVDEKAAFIEKIQEEREKLKIDTRIAEMKIENLTRNIGELEANHQKNLKKVSEQEKLKFGQLHKELLVQLEQKLMEQEEKHREYLARDWISRVVYDDMKSDMEAMQKKYNEAQNTIEYLQENELELNQRLIENEKALRNLKKSLDDTTLQASKAILDRTKCSREKVHFESRVQDLIQKLEDIEKEKLNLELKVAQLEKSNSELIQRTLLSHNQGEFKHLNKPSSHGSDVSQSGYTSEDVPMPSTQKGGVQRAENSSPDLGIESDAGRASSVELAAAPRLLKSIENLESRENVLEKETWKIQDKTNDRNERDTTTTSGPIIHDCAKVEQENIELRRKLARTKRAFENTAVKLQTSNKIKEQVERDIRQQILKTHTVLRNVRSNMDSELDAKKD